MRNFLIEKTERDTFKALASCVSKEKFRTNINAIHWDGEALYATDGRRLMKVSSLKLQELGEEHGWFTVDGNHLIEEEYGFHGTAPDYSRVIPDDTLLHPINGITAFKKATAKGKDCLLFTQACIYNSSLFDPKLFENIGASCEEWTGIAQPKSSNAIRLDGKSLYSNVTFVAMPLIVEEANYFVRNDA